MSKQEEETPKQPEERKSFTYPEKEDMYNYFHEEENIDPEDITKTKTTNETDRRGKNNEKDFLEDESGEDLDVPGSELDDEMEANGEEDEENNSYSIGGDRHDDLDEDK